ncbi:MAG: tetratricopeptide repeat protein [Planctomycetes bacterium]|nr:tetratricopeptide repeat protein [Planctomycetota bacterium]
MSEREPEQRTQEQQLRAFLERSTGFSIPKDRWAFLAEGFLVRIRERGFGEVGAYLDYLRRDPMGRNELEELFSLLTVRTTSFFRNPASYDALAQEVLPILARETIPGQPISIWSAGCSTGEEPYSIAMVAEATLGHLGRGYYVLASDIVKEALDRAKRGVYRDSVASGIPPDYRHFVDLVGGKAQISSKLQKRVEFIDHNLVHDRLPRSALGSWDVIFCRNVFIYFSQEQSLEIVARFHRALTPGGVLFLGHAEVFPSLEKQFDVVFFGDTYYYRKRPDPRVAPVQSPIAPVSSTLPRKPLLPVTPVQDADSANVTRTFRRPSTRRALPPSSGDTRSWGTGGETPTRAFRREAEPSRPYTLVARAAAELANGDLDAAGRSLRAAISRSPRWAQPRVALARLHEGRDQLAQAAAEVQIAVEVEPLSAEAHVYLGQIRWRQGELARAEVSLRRALYLDPDRVNARYDLAQVFLALGRKERACRELRNVIRNLRGLDGRPPDLSKGEDPRELLKKCRVQILDLGGSLADSSIWQVPPE